jgi:hypothetical protein
MFSPRTYARLVAHYNAEHWPLQALAVALGLAALALAWRAPSRPRQRLVWALLAAAWGWVAWAFLHQRFASINWAADAFAWAFGAQGLALAGWGVLGGRLGGRTDAAPMPVRPPPAGRARTGRAAGGAIVLTALLAWPLLGRLSGGTWASSQVFAFMPDPTALATLGFLLLVPRVSRPPWWLFVVPVMSCALGGALAWVLQAPLAWLAPALAGGAVVCAWQDRRAGPAAAMP